MPSMSRSPMDRERTVAPQPTPMRSRPPTDQPPRPTPLRPVTRVAASPSPRPRPSTLPTERPVTTAPPPRPTTGPDGEPPEIDVAAPDEGCITRRDGDRVLEICKVGTEFCVDEMERSRLVLRCRATRGDMGSGSGSGSGIESEQEFARVTWLRNNNRISDNDRNYRIESHGTELHFTQRRLPGRYTCILRNSAGSDRATTIVKSKIVWATCDAACNNYKLRPLSEDGLFSLPLAIRSVTRGTSYACIISLRKSTLKKL